MSPTNAARENGGESRSAAENFPLSIVYRVCVIGGEGIVQVIRRNRGDLATPRPIGKSESDRQRQISQKAPPPSHSPLPSRSCCQRMAGGVYVTPTASPIKEPKRHNPILRQQNFRSKTMPTWTHPNNANLDPPKQCQLGSTQTMPTWTHPNNELSQLEQKILNLFLFQFFIVLSVPLMQSSY